MLRHTTLVLGLFLASACAVDATRVEEAAAPGARAPAAPSGSGDLGAALAHDFAAFAASTCVAPPSPTLTAVASAPNLVDLAWDDSGAPEYEVYRSFTSGGPYERIGSTGAGVATFGDTTVSGGSTYYYVVRANGCVPSPDSNEASATATGVCALPPTFAGLQAATNATQSTCTIDLSWAAATPSCGGTFSYDVYRSRTPGFAPGPATRIATGVTGTSFTDAVNLADRTRYYYVVRAVETAARVVEERNVVERSDAASGAVTPAITYFDDFDGNRPPNAAAYWISSGTNLLGLVSGCHWQSPSTSYKFGALGVCGGTYTNSATSFLSLGGNGTVDPAVNGFAFPASGTATLTFSHWFSFENNWDGATLQYSTTGASGPWTMVSDAVSATEPYIAAGGYTGTARGVRSWTGGAGAVNGALRQVSVNLDALVGRTAWFALAFSTDSSVTYEGHYLDDVRLSAQRVEACATGSVPPGPAVAYTIDLPVSVQAGAPTPFVVTARDVWEQAVPDHAATAAVSTPDPRAVASTPITFAGGIANGEVTFGTAGAQLLAAAASLDPSVQGTASTLVTPGAPAGLAVQTQPTRTVAGSVVAPAVQVGIVDAFGNPVGTGTDAVTIAIANDAGGGTLRGTLTVAASGGVAAFPDLSIERAGQGYTLGATSGALTPATTVPFDVVPAAPASLGIRTQPTTTRAGEAVAPAVEAGLYDPYGNLAASAAVVTVQLDTNPGGSWLAGAARVAAVNGVARFSDLWLNRVGAGYTLLVSSETLPPVSTAPFDVVPGEPYGVEVRTQPADAVAGVPFAPPVTAAVLDRQGNLATQYGGPVHASLLGPAGATLLGTTSVTANAGLATLAGLAVDRVGTGYTLGLTGPGLAMGTSAAFAVTAGDPAALAFVGQPSSVQAGATMAPVRVAVQDAHGNLVSTASAPITLALDANPGGGLLGGTLTVSATGGVATFAELGLGRAGAGYTLAATAGGLTPAVSGPFDVTPAPAASLEFAVQPGSAAAGVALAPAIQVRARDAYGNVATGFGGTVSLALSPNPGGATLAGDTAVAATGGVATFPGLALDRAGSGYGLTASGAGVPSVASAPFDVAASAPAAVAFVTQPGAAVRAGATLPALTVELRDRYGNRTASGAEVLVGLATAPGAATLSGTRRVAAVAGQAVFADLSLDRAGSGYALSAVSPGLSPGATETFDVTSAPAARLAVAGLPATVDAGAVTTVSLTAHDAYGNLDVAYAATVTLTSTDPAAVLPVVRLTAGVAPPVGVTFRSRGAQVLTARDAVNPSVQGEASTLVVAQEAPPAAAAESGCGCSSGNAGELGLLLALGAVWRAAVTPRRRGPGRSTDGRA